MTRHRWADKVSFPNKSERECLHCGIVKVTRREFEGGRDIYWTLAWARSDRVRGDACVRAYRGKG